MSWGSAPSMSGDAHCVALSSYIIFFLMQIPGTYRDAMTTNTQLGKAVRDACQELDALAALEREALDQAEALLRTVGFKGSLFDIQTDKVEDEK